MKEEWAEEAEWVEEEWDQVVDVSVPIADIRCPIREGSHAISRSVQNVVVE